MKYRKQIPIVQEDKYPSPCGSHKSMIDEDYNEFNSGDHNFVVCKDDNGSYVTLRQRLDNGLADFNRTVNSEYRELELKNKIKMILESSDDK
jgi:hypothetical protein